jgi:hypothetical protein
MEKLSPHWILAESIWYLALSSAMIECHKLCEKRNRLRCINYFFSMKPCRQAAIRRYNHADYQKKKKVKEEFPFRQDNAASVLEWMIDLFLLLLMHEQAGLLLDRNKYYRGLLTHLSFNRWTLDLLKIPVALQCSSWGINLVGRLVLHRPLKSSSPWPQT